MDELKKLALELYVERTNNHILRSQHAKNPDYIKNMVANYLPICINEAKAILGYFEDVEKNNKKSKKDVKK